MGPAMSSLGRIVCKCKCKWRGLVLDDEVRRGLAVVEAVCYGGGAELFVDWTGLVVPC